MLLVYSPSHDVIAKGYETGKVKGMEEFHICDRRTQQIMYLADTGERERANHALGPHAKTPPPFPQAARTPRLQNHLYSTESTHQPRVRNHKATPWQ